MWNVPAGDDGVLRRARGGECDPRRRDRALDDVRSSSRSLYPHVAGAPMRRTATTDGVYVVCDRFLRGALGAALMLALGGCSENVASSLACPELCTDQSAQLKD